MHVCITYVYNNYIWTKFIVRLSQNQLQHVACITISTTTKRSHFAARWVLVAAGARRDSRFHSQLCKISLASGVLLGGALGGHTPTPQTIIGLGCLVFSLTALRLRSNASAYTAGKSLHHNDVETLFKRCLHCCGLYFHVPPGAYPWTPLGDLCRPDPRFAPSYRISKNATVWCLIELEIEQGLTSHQKIIGHIGDDFYRSYDQTNSVKALKETSWSFR